MTAEMISGKKNILPVDGYCSYMSSFLSAQESASYFKYLESHIIWKAQEIMMFGKKVMQPRLMAWYGDPNAAYRYSGTTFQPQSWTSELIEIKKKVEDLTSTSFNSVLLNFYRDGSDYMGFHSDNEKELGPEPVIASLSLGEKRVFKVQHKKNKDQKLSFELESGSLLVMNEDMQSHWKHSISKTQKTIKPRINLTFRKIIKT